MKWKTKGFFQKQREKHNWHRWFAWFPVELGGDGSGQWAWLETVARKCYVGDRHPGDVWWEYNSITVAQHSEAGGPDVTRWAEVSQRRAYDGW